MDLPSQIDSHLEVIQTGVESEEVEEINDAYKDILEELGIHLEKKAYLHQNELLFKENMTVK